MKRKKWLLGLLVLFLLALTACSGNANSDSEVDDVSGGVGAENQNQTGETGMDEVNQLIVGTLLLDGTENEVSASQAADMLPLWQLYQTMASEDWTASEELQAIVNQIKALFTEEQQALMATFDYTNPMALMGVAGLGDSDAGTGDRENGFEWLMPEDGGFGEPPEGGNFQGGLEMPRSGDDRAGGGPGGGGDFADGGMEGGFGGMGAGGNVDPEAMATAQAERGGSGFVNRQSLMFLPALIEYLEGIASS